MSSALTNVNQERPRFSIIVPTYNRAHLLTETLEAILDQNTSMEVWVLDDASSDGTPQLLNDYPDPRVRYVRHPQNLGMTANYNFGLRAVRGHLVRIVNSDDVLMPGALQRIDQTFARDPGLGLVSSPAALMDAQGRELGLAYWPQPLGADLLRPEPSGAYHGPAVASYMARYFDNVAGATPQVTVRRELLSGHRALFRSRFKFFHDFEFWLRLLWAGAPWRPLSEPDLRFRLHPAGATSSMKSLYLDLFDAPPLQRAIAHRLDRSIACSFAEHALVLGILRAEQQSSAEGLRHGLQATWQISQQLRLPSDSRAMTALAALLSGHRRAELPDEELLARHVFLQQAQV